MKLDADRGFSENMDFSLKNYISNLKFSLKFRFRRTLLLLKIKIGKIPSICVFIVELVTTYSKFRSVAFTDAEKNVPKGRIYEVEKNDF